MIIYLDFDGTVVEHAYPSIGRCNFGCFEVILKLQNAGHIFILNTYRADLKDGSLEKALKLINENHWMLWKDREAMEDMEIKPIHDFCVQKIHPSVFDWDSIKKSNELFIDDIAHKIPLKKAVMTHGDMVDWDELDKQFAENGLY
jgi:hypothetical protein